MIVENLGGGDCVIEEMKAADRPPCGCCKGTDHAKFYGRVRLALFQFLFIRPLVELGTAVSHYIGSQPLFLVCTFVAVVQFLCGFIFLVVFCKSVVFFSFPLYSLVLYVIQSRMCTISTETCTPR